MVNPSFYLENYFWDDIALCDIRYASAMKPLLHFICVVLYLAKVTDGCEAMDFS